MTEITEQIPIWISMPVVIAAVSALSVLCSYQVRKRHTLEELTQNNEIAGFKFGVIGVLYAVMLGMAVVVVWEDFEYAQSSASKEASLIGDIYRDAIGLPAEESAELRTEIRNYGDVVFRQEWGAMQNRGRNPVAQATFENLYSIVLSVEPKTTREEIVVREIFQKLNDLADERRSRLSEAKEGMPGLLWMALIVGGGVTIAFTFFFGNRNWRAHCLMTALLAGLITMMLYVIHEIDHPYTGAVRVSPDVLKGVLDRISK